ncbi:MAG: AAA family ATPase [Conexivisphaera sp.]
MGQPETCGSQGHAEEIKDNIVKIFEALNDIGRVIVVFDEAQYLRYSTVGLRSVLAHVYDYMDGITLILTGSEVGLLHDFVGVDDPDPELYGRYHSGMELKPLDGEKSREFLRRGFEQLGIRVNEDVLERAVSELDGIIGWLVYFGKLYADRGKEAVEGQ